MARVNEMMESRYLKQADVDNDTPVTIAKVGKANVAKKDEEPEFKWLIKFAEFDKPMVLNSTNIKRLARAHGDESDDWIGKKMVIYVDPDVEFGGNVVGGLRLRASRPPQQETVTKQTRGNFEELDSDIPFINIGRGIAGHAI